MTTQDTLRAMGIEGFYEEVANGWDPGTPVPMPVRANHTFAETSAEVGCIFKDLPVEEGGVLSDKRKKNAKAYIMVKRDRNGDTAFLWCDGDGKPVKRSQIKKQCGLSMSVIKEQLVEDYNNTECSLIDEYNVAIVIAKARTLINAYAERALNGRDDGSRIVLEGDQFKQKEYAFAYETDPELNGHE
ncbi:hypothetical protein FLAG1_07617 [Fusarium langsethiae]|uniref:Uncharacterized protein n=1 Tax=Fusarium langsethiae TaxID=179993 RepID=A0A0M9ETV4_FUSLA|nr:hypothetical protein FLAG1_07617 [Fusarium langsethiae]GKU05044.1 unnamed protein product [Fusarium langsethiae]GKU19377.1 unnamed protein product [Fusarium langsethiae]